MGRGGVEKKETSIVLIIKDELKMETKVKDLQALNMHILNLLGEKLSKLKKKPVVRFREIDMNIVVITWIALQAAIAVNKAITEKHILERNVNFDINQILNDLINKKNETQDQ